MALDSIYFEDFIHCFQQWEWRWDRCIQLQVEHSEVDKSFQLARLL
jgi:hypothetical protein